MNRRARLGLAATCGDVDDGLDLPPQSNIGMQWNPVRCRGLPALKGSSSVSFDVMTAGAKSVL